MNKESWIREMKKWVNNMTPKERSEFDKGIEEMKGEICHLHGDVCQCSKETKMGYWKEMKGTK